jgi:hypothetical protein
MWSPTPTCGRSLPEPVTLGGRGHNAHVEDPAAVVKLVRPFA